MSFVPMLAPVAEELARVDALIQARLDSDVALVRKVARHIVASGGVAIHRGVGPGGDLHRADDILWLGPWRQTN
jgi:hypothetical protein